LHAHAPTFDLQSHSQHSDGELSPREVVRAAAAAGVELLALSDHDSVDGVAEATAAAGEIALRLVPAVEISALHAGEQDLHILGYLIDHGDAALLERLERFRADRRQRAQAMAQALEELGFELDHQMLDQRVSQGKSIGRPHLAMAVVEQPANARRLEAEGHNEPSAFFDAYLAEGRPAFRPRSIPTVPQAIATIHAAGGVAVWAHPFWHLGEPGAVLEAVDRFRSWGLDGIECFYPTHTAEQVDLLTERCDRLDLLSTGSADFHGPRHREFSRFRAFSTYGHQPRLGPIAMRG
jgi:predicted metal-dependent phosphoesterase TrpH